MRKLVHHEAGLHVLAHIHTDLGLGDDDPSPEELVGTWGIGNGVLIGVRVLLSQPPSRVLRVGDILNHVAT